MTRRESLIAVLALAAFAFPALASAQFSTSNDPFTVSADPSAPAAHSPVTLTPVSGSIDISAATMTVTVDGKKTYSGNAAPVTITSGAAGQVENVTVAMRTAGGTFRQLLAITPEDVTLVAEPLSTAPPLYPGKPLVPLGGSVRVVAVADLRSGATRLDPATLAYDWTVDGTQIANASGIGKRTIIVDSPLQYRTSTVEVSVTSPDGSLAGGASIDLSPSDPTMRIYENDPLLGIRFDRALEGSFSLTGSEAALYAAPYSFPNSLGSPKLAWYVSGALAQTGNLITLRPTGQGQGQASVTVTNSGQDVAAASASLTVSFGGASNSSLFGL